MITGTKISKGKELTKTKKLLFYSRPKYIYIPLISGNDKNITVVVKKGDYVYKGSIVGKRKGNFKIPLYSSVSGTVIDFVEKNCGDGSLVKCVMIENDFKEKIAEKQAVREKINDYSKAEFIKVLQNCGIIGMGGAGFPTYAKYNTNKEIKTLIVNAVECEPYITADIILMKEKSEEILEAMDAIMEINGIKEGIIAIKRHNKLIQSFENYLGTYPRIKIVVVPNLYPMGWERNVIKYVKDIDYKDIPLEQGIVVNNVSTVYAIYEALKYNKPLIERVVTFTGEMLKKPQNVYVKIGSHVGDVISGLDGYKRNKDIFLISGGPMMGKSIPSDDLVITSNMNCILVLKKTTDEQVLNCLRCGKCVAACPSHLSPVLIKDNLKRIDTLKELNVDKCIECGLCSYTCPSKINIRGCVVEAKKIIRSEED